MNSVELCWNITSYLSVLTQFAAASVCLGIFVLPYLRSRSKAVKAGAVYGVVMIVLYVMPPRIDNILAYLIGTLAALLVMYAEDRHNLNQKIFLSVTFFSVRWLSVAMARMIDDFLERVLFAPGMDSRIWLRYGLYVAVRLLNLFVCTLFLLLTIHAVNSTYKNKDRLMGRAELLMLLVPSLSGVVGYAIFHLYQIRSELSGIYNVLCFFYYLISILAVFVTIVLFQNWKALQEEQAGQQLLENQIDSIKTHIEGVEKLYGDLRSLRHDMGNHIQMIERLMAAGNSAEASAYLERLKGEWQELTPEIRTGNPVVDMILLEKKKEAEARGIRFECDFCYPNGTGLDAFDVSVLLYNALNNCLESVNGEDPYIKVQAFRKNSVFVLITSNSFTGRLRMDAAEGLPFTTKKSGGHGIGLKNMRRVARKYMGDLSFEQDKDEVTVGIMLQIA